MGTYSTSQMHLQTGKLHRYLQVLVDDQKRQLYDLSIHSQAGRFAKEASLGEDKYR